METNDPANTRGQIFFWIIFATLIITAALLDKFKGMLRDNTVATKKPYSFARVQLAWWSIIIISAFAATIIRSGSIPALDNSVLTLLGIGSATTAAGVLTTPGATSTTQPNGENLILDILSDAQNVTVTRFQAVVFNLVIGIWMIYEINHRLWCYHHLCAMMPELQNCKDHQYNFILPNVNNQVLLLLGISAATYAGLKPKENHGTSAPAPHNNIPNP